jgi:hypothetical protein
MIARADSNLQMMKLDNVIFQKTSGANLPFTNAHYTFQNF